MTSADREAEQRDIVAEIERLDSMRQAATLAADVDTLRRLLADDLRYVHSSGTDEDKRTYLERVGSGHYQYHALQAIRRDFRVWNDVVLVNGDLRIDVSVQGRRKTVYSRYLQVWRRGPQDWQMASWQSTPLPAPGQAGT